MLKHINPSGSADPPSAKMRFARNCCNGVCRVRYHHILFVPGSNLVWNLLYHIFVRGYWQYVYRVHRGLCYYGYNVILTVHWLAGYWNVCNQFISCWIFIAIAIIFGSWYGSLLKICCSKSKLNISRKSLMTKSTRYLKKKLGPAEILS